LYSASTRVHASNVLSSPTRATSRTATACSLQTQAGAAVGQTALVSCTKVPTFPNPYNELLLI